MLVDPILLHVGYICTSNTHSVLNYMYALTCLSNAAQYYFLQLFSHAELLESEPENRPQFSELVSTISDILHSTAGYIELSMALQEDKSYSLATEITPDI